MWWRVLIFWLFVLFPGVALALARCEAPKPLNALLITLDALPLSAGTLSEEWRTEIERKLSRVDAMPPDTLSRLRAEAVTREPLDALIEEARHLIQTGTISNPAMLDSRVKAMWRGLEETCEVQSIVVLGAFEGEPIRHAASPVPFADGLSTVVPVVLQMQRMGALMAGIIAFAVTAFALEFGVKRVFLRVFHCRSCLIKADLIVDDTRFEGSISLLSRDGCCFRAAQHEMLAWTAQQSSGAQYELAVGFMRIPLRPVGTVDAILGCSFHGRLAPAAHRELLEASKISTFHRNWPESLVLDSDTAAESAAYRVAERPMPVSPMHPQNS